MRECDVMCGATRLWEAAPERLPQAAECHPPAGSTGRMGCGRLLLVLRGLGPGAHIQSVSGDAAPETIHSEQCVQTG